MYVCMHVVVFVSMCVSERNRETKSVCVCVENSGVSRCVNWMAEERDRQRERIVRL